MKSRKVQKALRDFVFRDFHYLATSRQVRCHPGFLLVKMLVKILPTLQRGDFTSMGKLTDTKLRSMKPNGKVQKEWQRALRVSRRKEQEHFLADGLSF